MAAGCAPHSVERIFASDCYVCDELELGFRAMDRVPLYPVMGTPGFF